MMTLATRLARLERRGGGGLPLRLRAWLGDLTDPEDLAQADRDRAAISHELVDMAILPPDVRVWLEEREGR